MKREWGATSPPHYNKEEIKREGKVIVTPCTKIHNCALIYFTYDSKEGGKLKLCTPEELEMLQATY